MVAWPPRSRFHSAEVLPKFVVWSERPAITWLTLPRFFTGELPAAGVGVVGCGHRGEATTATKPASRRAWVAVTCPARVRHA